MNHQTDNRSARPGFVQNVEKDDLKPRDKASPSYTRIEPTLEPLLGAWWQQIEVFYCHECGALVASRLAHKHLHEALNSDPRSSNDA